MCSHSLHNHSNPNEEQLRKKSLSLAFWLNLVFSIIELIGGILTHSTAIIADAFHDFMDAMAIGVALIFEKISGRKPTAKFSYGFKRFSLLSALILSVFLIVGAVFMINSAIQSFVEPSELHSLGMIWLAILGLSVNGLAFFKIKKLEHTQQGHNHNSRSIMLHLFEDVLGWAAVLIGAVVIHFTGWNWIDGMLAIGIALFIGYNAVKNLWKIGNIMLQSVPENVDIAALSDEVSALDGVNGTHDIYVWSLDGNTHVGTIHIVLNNTSSLAKEDILEKAIKLMQKHHITHPTIQIETTTFKCC